LAAETAALFLKNMEINSRLKVLLISPNVEFLPDPVFPIGLAYIAGALKENQIPFKILDLCFAEDFKEDITSAITLFEPTIIGLSIRNIDNVSYPAYTSYLAFYRQIIDTIRKQSNALIVLGGSGFTLLPDAVMADLQADIGIQGEGESAFIRLLQNLEKKDTAISGIYNPTPEIIQNIDDIPVPDRSGFNSQAYLKYGGMGNIQTKRGCPFKCIYCTYPIIEGKNMRLRDPEAVCDEIETLLSDGIDTIFFVDNEFNYPMDHALAISKEIIKRKINFGWGCYVNPAFVTPELIHAMRNAGCTGVEFGCDAASPKMLKNMGKNFTVDDIKKASDICKQADMPFCHSLLLGGPGETMDTVKETLDTILQTSPTAAICMIGIRVFPNTRLSKIAENEGMVSPDNNYLEPVFYLSSAIEDEIVPFLESFAKEHRTWIFPGLNINMNETMQKKLRKFGIKGPMWEYMKRAKKR
jgi:radical SAM superfamily enzyme YgiQ (UPF0313 family)